MKRLLYIFTAIIAIGCITSCMQNDGYIGELYGQWRLEKIVSPDTTHACDTVFWAFQADIFSIRKVDYNSYVSMALTGLYRHREGTMQLNFYNRWGHEVVTAEDTTLMLNELKSLYIDEMSPIFDVKNLDWKNMELEYNNRNYYFKKLN